MKVQKGYNVCTQNVCGKKKYVKKCDSVFMHLKKRLIVLTDRPSDKR